MRGHGLIHDDDERRAGSVIGRKISALEQRDAERLKEAAVDIGEHGEFELPTLCGLALECVSRARESVRCRKDVSETNGYDARLGQEAINDGAVEGRGRYIRGILVERQLIAGDEDVVG